MFDTKEIKKAFETFGKEVIQEARSNLKTQNIDSSGNLSKGLNYEFEGYKNGFRFVINMPEYGIYQDVGVKGSKTSYQKTKSAQAKSKTNFSYKNKMPPSGDLDKWVIRKGLANTRDDKGRFISRKSMVFAIRKSIFQKGIEAKEWFTDAFELKFKRLEPKIEDAMTISIEKLLDFTVKENFKK